MTRMNLKESQRHSPCRQLHPALLEALRAAIDARAAAGGLRLIPRAQRPLQRGDTKQCWIKLHERRVDRGVLLVTGVAIGGCRNPLRRTGTVE